MRFGGRQALSAAQQMLHLRNSAIYPGEGTLTAGSLTWRFKRRPTGLSREYELRLAFSEDGVPRIYVDRPDLVLLAEGDRLPHVYKQRPTHLCLYLPSAREWQPWDRLDQTVLPWADIWLIYFEDWLAGGRNEWRGGGEHPDADTVAPRERRRLRRAMG